MPTLVSEGLPVVSHVRPMAAAGKGDKPFRLGIFTVARVFAFITVDVSMMLPLARI